MSKNKNLIVTNDGLIVANSYPAFVKARYESYSGNSLSQECDIKKSDYKNAKDYLSDFNKRLNITIKNLYEAGTYSSLDEDEYGNKLIIGDLDDKFVLMLIRTEKYLVLLDLGVCSKMKSLLGICLQPIPSSADVSFYKNYDNHVRTYADKDGLYKVTNTYDSFLSYSDINSLEIKNETYDTFYSSFFKYINEESNSTENPVNSKLVLYSSTDELDVNTDYIFDYVVFGDSVIIIDFRINEEHIKIRNYNFEKNNIFNNINAKEILIEDESDLNLFSPFFNSFVLHENDIEIELEYVCFSYDTAGLKRICNLLKGINVNTYYSLSTDGRYDIWVNKENYLAVAELLIKNGKGIA